MSRLTAIILLLICTSIWGFAFVFQKNAMHSMGPLTFAASRLWLGGLALAPLAIVELRRFGAGWRFSAREMGLIVLLSVLFFGGSWLQQAGLAHTSVTNGGFLTALYVLVVPVVAFLATGHKPHAVIYIGAPMAVVGVFLLNNARLDALNIGDLLVIASTLFWGGHIFLLGYLARKTRRPTAISSLSFVIAALLATPFALTLEAPTLAGLSAGLIPILYTGLLSTAVAFTLQAIGQQHLPPANAAIILSSESLFAALAGALLLGERLTPIGYLGAATLFGAILLVEGVPALRARAASPAT